MKQATSTKEMRNKSGTMVVPVGTVCTISFKGEGSAKCYIQAPGQEKPFTASAAVLPDYFSNDFERPNMAQLEEWVNDGTCESIMGETVEPDGYDQHGSPSWLRALGMI